jgi:hypothetical protein
MHQRGSRDDSVGEAVFDLSETLNMNMIDQAPGVDSQAKAELREACDRFVRGSIDPEAARRSRERMAKAREEIRKRLGVQNIVVDLVRQARDSQ